jgi:superfamily II RNA helicase
MKRFISILAFGLSLELIAFAMTVEEAYRAIPHRYTPFDTKAAKMTAKEAACLESFFRLVNLAIVKRVQTLAWFQSHGTQGFSFQDYQKQMVDLLTQFAALPTSKNLEDVRRRVVEAIKDQMAYFEEWEEAVKKGQRFRYALNAGVRHPRVLASSQKLQQAYARLMQLYPKEETRNQQAFFDHLCALDFL